MKKVRVDSWSDYPLKVPFNIKNFFVLNSKFFHPKPLYISSLWILGFASLFSLKFLKIFVPLLLLYFYQKIMVKRSLKNFRIRRKIPLLTKEDKTVSFEYRVDNPSPFRYYNFSVFDKNEASSSKRVLTSFHNSLNPNESINFHHLVKMDNGMGLKGIGPLLAMFTDSLGINRVTYYEDLLKETKVYPSVHPTEKTELEADMQSMTFGNFDSHQLGNNVNFYSTREYVQGDNTKHINWKLSLKSQSIIVNQFESNVNAKFYTVLLDDEQLHYGEGKYSSLEYCKDLMLSLLHSQVRSNNEMGFYTSKKHISAKSGRSHLNALELYISTLETTKVSQQRTYSRKHVQSHDIKAYFKKLRFLVPAEANLYVFAGLIPGAILETYLNQLSLIVPRYQKVHLVLTHGLGHLKNNLGKEESIWLSKLESDLSTSLPEILGFCRKKNISLSLVDMDSKFKYSHKLKKGFQPARL